VELDGIDRHDIRHRIDEVGDAIALLDRSLRRYLSGGGMM
jgi:hypothetical protein